MTSALTSATGATPTPIDFAMAPAAALTDASVQAPVASEPAQDLATAAQALLDAPSPASSNASLDVEAALADPAVPGELKDTLQLAQLADRPDSAGTLLRGLGHDGIAATSALHGHEGFSALPASDQSRVAQSIVDNSDPGIGNGLEVVRDLTTLIGDPSFQALDPAQRSATLTETVLLQSPAFNALPASDQRLVNEALAARKPDDTELPAAIASLLENAAFEPDGQFSAFERTAILSQVRNYPDSRSVENLERLVEKSWFREFNSGDSQRAAKAVGYLSQNDAGDMEIINNTLDLFLAPDAPYRFDFGEDAAYGSVPPVPGDLFQMNPDFIRADNNPVDTSASSSRSGELRVIGHTFVHEVNHMRNWDKSLSLNSSYGFHEEYRAFYVGAQAQHGRPPTVADVIDRVAGFVNVDGTYDHLAYLLNQGGKDAQEIVGHLNTILGRDDLTIDNARTEVNALVRELKLAQSAGEPLPPALAQPAGVTIGPPGTNNINNA